MTIKIVSFLDNWTLEDATNNLSPNVGNKLTNFTSDVSVPSSGFKMSKKKNPFKHLDQWRGNRHAVPRRRWQTNLLHPKSHKGEDLDYILSDCYVAKTWPWPRI